MERKWALSPNRNFAQKKIGENKSRQATRDVGDATRTLSSLHAAGRVPDDQLKKLHAPTQQKSAPTPAPAPVTAPELARLYEALNTANTALLTTDDSALRSAIVSAVLGVLVKETERVIATINKTTRE